MEDIRDVILDELRKLVKRYEEELAKKRSMRPEPEWIRCNPGEVCNHGDVVEEPKE